MKIWRQDELGKANNKVTAQTKADAKAREAFAALHEENVQLDSLLVDTKSQYEASLTQVKEQHERQLDELQTCVAQAEAEARRSFLDCNRKLERVERQGHHERKIRDDRIADLERRMAGLAAEHGPAQETISSHKKQLAEATEELNRMTALLHKQRAEEDRLRERVRVFEAEAAALRGSAQDLRKELGNTAEELHQKRLQVCRAEQEAKEVRDDKHELEEQLRTNRLTHAVEVNLSIISSRRARTRS